MAMTNCKECGESVSSGAKKCPHCGIKNPAPPGSENFLGIIIVVGVVYAVFSFMGGDDEEAPRQTAAEKAAEKAECKESLQCWGDEHSVSAAIYCDDYVERLAKYSAKWTDDVLEPKFSHFRWKNQSKGYITYIGDKIKFQNGFGAWQNYVYKCDFDPATNTVLNVGARPGYL